MRVGAVALVIVGVLGVAPAAAAQQRERRMPGSRMTPADVQSLFDAYTLVQAQEALRLSDSQYSEFVTRMKSLQETRRGHHRTRMRLLRELEHAAQAGKEVDLRERLTRLREHDAKAAEELRHAYGSVDEVLDLKQQARFRVFEERMEQRKFELMMRARQRQPSRSRP
jgi:hypothetical protein